MPHYVIACSNSMSILCSASVSWRNDQQLGVQGVQDDQGLEEEQIADLQKALQLDARRSMAWYLQQVAMREHIMSAAELLFLLAMLPAVLPGSTCDIPACGSWQSLCRHAAYLMVSAFLLLVSASLLL